jgi:methylated-DNA-[protein]-cysteine S-methyltransferase
MKYYHKTIASPVGRLKLIASEKGLAAVLWIRERPHPMELAAKIEVADHPLLLQAEQQLHEYFSGERDRFPIQLDLQGSDFQLRVWQALQTIPYGETRSYGDIAKLIGDPTSVRAVGGAVNKNPVSIILPCHRVIGAAGNLVGFGGGLENKSFLLRLEDKRRNPTLF